MKVAALVNQKKDSGYVKNKLPTGHPAWQWLRVWDRFWYEEKEAGTILLVLDTTTVHSTRSRQRGCCERIPEKEGDIIITYSPPGSIPDRPGS